MSTLFADLTWWQVGSLVIYIIYTIYMGVTIFNVGLKRTFIGYGEKSVKLYHILWGLISLPAIVLGKFLPVIKKCLSIPIFPLKQDKKQTKSL